MKNKKTEANLSMIVSKTFSGLNANALKYLLPLWIAPLTGVMFRCVFAAIVFWIISIFWKQEKTTRREKITLFLLGAIIARCIWVARRACSPQSAFIAMGYAGMLLAQVGVNVGMCLYVFPVVGLTLPFISYGGTSIVTMFAAMGIISSIKMRSLPSWLRDRIRI